MDTFTAFQHWLAAEIARLAGESWWEDDEMSDRLSTLIEIRNRINKDSWGSND